MMRIQIHFDIQLWDIGGAGAMQGSMLDKYAFGAHAIMLVYDVTNGASFDQLAGITPNFTIKWNFSQKNINWSYLKIPIQFSHIF